MMMSQFLCALEPLASSLPATSCASICKAARSISKEVRKILGLRTGWRGVAGRGLAGVCSFVLTHVLKLSVAGNVLKFCSG